MTRTQILSGSYVYPADLVKLRTTKHFVDRLEQRGIGVDCIPTMVRVTKDNIYCGEAEGNEFISVVVRLNYNSSRFIFLCFNPKDGALKTLWFKDKKPNVYRKQDAESGSEQAVRDARSGDQI